MTAVDALALAHAALAGVALFLAVAIGRRGDPLAGERTLSTWAALVGGSLVGGALSLQAEGAIGLGGMLVREAGLAATIVLMVTGTGRLVGRRPPNWLVGVLVVNGLVRVGLLATTDLVYVDPGGVGTHAWGPWHLPTAGLTFPLVVGWLVATRQDWRDDVERRVLFGALAGTMVVGALAATGRGLLAEVATGLLAVPLLVGLALLHQRRRRLRDEQVELLRERESRLALELESANLGLRDALALREDLLDVVTHELRTPLTPIRGFLELLARGEQPLDAEDTPQLLEIMLRNAVRLEELVDEVLLARHLRAGQLPEIEGPQDVDVVELVLAAVQRLREVGRPVADGEVHVDAAPGLAVHVRPREAMQALARLLDNGLRHGAPPVMVLCTSTSQQMVELAVLDTGPGIPAEFRPELFAPFAQADRGSRREVQGLGLGLTVAARLCEDLGGSLREEPRERGEGACFVVRLPAAKGARTPAGAAGARR